MNEQGLVAGARNGVELYQEYDTKMLSCTLFSDNSKKASLNYLSTTASFYKYSNQCTLDNIYIAFLGFEASSTAPKFEVNACPNHVIL